MVHPTHSPLRTLPIVATLLAIRGPHTGVRFTLNDERPSTLGRSGECDIVFADSQVSRVHAEIEPRGHAWYVRDKGSRNGIGVNGQRVVGEQVLLRNDELQVGASLLLFDSDFDVQNATFSNVSVYLSAPHEETREVAPVATLSSATAAGAQRTGDESLSLLQQVGEVLAPGVGSMAETLPSVIERLAALWSADAALVSLWDPVTSDLRPVYARAPEAQMAVHGGTIREVFHSRKAILTSDMGVDYRYASAELRPAETGRRSILCAPLLAGVDTAIGVVHLERRAPDAWSLKDLRLFQAVANLLAVVIEQMQRADARPVRELVDPPGETTRSVVGKSPAFEKTLTLIRKVAEHSSTVLLIGETGTGKEVLAHEVHRLSQQGRRGGPFVALNCAAIPAELFESELFGHERGAFTGADSLQRGKVELAHGGTLFLDEIGELSPALQPKLLRFLQEKVFYRVGGSRPLRVEVRLVAATNRNLLEGVREGRFREDLYHRLSVFPLIIPALRERRPDIRPLAEFFLARFAREFGKSIVGISDDALILLERYPWPGNIREMQNVLERAVLLAEGKVILPRDLLLPGTLTSLPKSLGTAPTPPGSVTSAAARESTGSEEPADLRLESLERRAIRRALEQTRWNQVQAAELLGIHRNTLRKKIADYEIEPEGRATDS